jgi:hypothetical protein
VHPLFVLYLFETIKNPNHFCMKKLVILSCMIVSTFAAYSQTLGFGAKAGLNFSKLSNNVNTMRGSENATGFVGGVFARAGLLGFFVQPEVLYSQRKGAFTSNADSTAVTNTLSYIDVPVLVGYKLLFARINFGPNFQFLVNARQDANSASKDPNFSKDNFKSSAVGFQAGIGVDLMKLSLDLRYDGNFGSLGNKVDRNGQTIDYSTRASMWQLTLGYRIF